MNVPYPPPLPDLLVWVTCELGCPASRLQHQWQPNPAGPGRGGVGASGILGPEVSGQAVEGHSRAVGKSRLDLAELPL